MEDDGDGHQHEKLKHPFWFFNHRELASAVLTVFFLFLSIGVTMPLFPELITELMDGETRKDRSAEAMTPSSHMATIGSAIAFLVAPLLGGLSDRYGRKVFLVPPILMGIFDIGCPAIFDPPSLTLLYFSRSMQGSHALFLSAIGAYMVDMAIFRKLASRSELFGLMGAGFGMAFSIGPLIGGVLSEWISIISLFQIATGCLVACLLIILFYLPESLPEEHRTASVSLSRMNPISGVASVFRNRVIAALSLMIFLYDFALQSVISTFQLYAQFRYDWHTLDNGVYCSVFGIMGAFAQMYCLPRMTRSHGLWKTIIICFVINALCWATYAASPVGWPLYVAVVPRGLALMSFPACQSLISQEFPRDEQGVVMALLASLKVVASASAPLICNSLFQYFKSDDAPVYIPGIVYWLLTILNLFCAGVGLVCLTRWTKVTPHPLTRNESIANPPIPTLDEKKKPLLSCEEGMASP